MYISIYIYIFFTQMDTSLVSAELLNVLNNNTNTLFLSDFTETVEATVWLTEHLKNLKQIMTHNMKNDRKSPQDNRYCLVLVLDLDDFLCCL